LESNLTSKVWDVRVPPILASVYEKVRIGRMTGVSDSDGNDEEYKNEDMEAYQNGIVNPIKNDNLLDPKSSKIYMFATMQILRQICCDPNICVEHLHKFCTQEEVKQVLEITPPKYTETLSYIKNRVLRHEKVVIFCYYKLACTRLANFLEKNGAGKAVIITGDTKKEIRRTIIDDFQTSGEFRILIATMCMKEVVTITRANHCIFQTNWWNNADEMQSVGRLHRLGQTRNVHMAYLIMKGTIDERIKEVSENKGSVPSSRQLFKILGLQMEEIKEVDMPKQYVFENDKISDISLDREGEESTKKRKAERDVPKKNETYTTHDIFQSKKKKTQKNARTEADGDFEVPHHEEKKSLVFSLVELRDKKEYNVSTDSVVDNDHGYSTQEDVIPIEEEKKSVCIVPKTTVAEVCRKIKSTDPLVINLLKLQRDRDLKILRDDFDNLIATFHCKSNHLFE
jgi:hypothetical protein